MTRPVITATGVSKRYVMHGRKATALKERFVQSAKREAEFVSISPVSGDTASARR